MSHLPYLYALQFAYRPNRSTDDAIAIALYTAISHLDKRNTYVRMLFIDYNSAFNTIVPSKLIIKLGALGMNPALCNWVLDFLTGRLNTGAQQGCVLSPILYSLFTHDVAKHASNSIIMFASLEEWYQENNLSLNKTNELIVDFRKQQREQAPIHIDGVHITDNLKWSTHTVSVV
jgi:hypothetical protein